MKQTKRRRALTREDLLGLPAISYLRFSSRPQEKGSSVDRQRETLDRVVAYFELKLDRSLEDRALSASKGHHRKYGNLRVLLDSADRGDFHGQRTVVIVEAMDRLFREGVLDVFPILGQIVRNNLVLVTGDYTIWDEVSIDGAGNHKLIAEINAAKEYAARLSEFAEGGHLKRRVKLTKLAEDPTAPRPLLNGRVPFWLILKAGEYEEHPVYAGIVRSMFRMCADGMPVRQIAKALNAGTVKAPNGGDWRGPRIGAILRDRHVLGFFTPRQQTGTKRKAVGAEVRILKQVVSDELWLAARNVLDDRQKIIVGRRGKDVPNLFTGKSRCSSCGGAMRVDTGGGIRRGVRKRHLICAAYIESKTCTDKRRIDLRYYERPILLTLLSHTHLVPRTRAVDTTVADVSTMRVNLESISQSIATLAPRVGVSQALAAQVEKMAIEADTIRRSISVSEMRISAAAAIATRADDTWRFIKRLVRPAVNEDVDAREQLRTLLAGIKFEIGVSPHGGVDVILGEAVVTIDPPGWDNPSDVDDIDDGVD